ncbi:alpha/beta hydrolase (plasmid) [Streptomyces sp. L7]
MIWIIVILAILVVLALALGALTILLARRVVMPGSPGSSPSTKPATEP